tara:strand:- start:106 stop:1008 length:903 start_codon:yes stop_codon:yes gene_type:complete
MDKKSKKSVLGRGLNSLLGDSNNKTDSIIENKITKKISLIGKTIEIDIDKINLNPKQPRTRFNKESLNELAISIKNYGIIQPITVLEKSKNNFELISGERRLRASKLIQLKRISAFVKDVKDSEKLEMALVENIQREDLDPIEIAISYKRLTEEINITHEKLSIRVGKKRSTISNYLRLLKLDPIIQSGLRDGFISMAHGRELSTIKSYKNQLDLYEKIISKKLSVRETEKIVRKFSTKKSSSEDKNSYNSLYQKKISLIEKKFKINLNLKIFRKGSGQIIIPFKSKVEFDDIIKRINNV